MQAWGASKAIGDHCPMCKRPLERGERAFFWITKYHDGAYCKPCNSVWPIKGEEIEPLKAAKRRTE